MGQRTDISTLTAFAQKIKDTFVIKDKTEAQALVLSSTYPNCVYYTSDTHCIVIGGNIYGRGEQIVASNFAFLPASEQAPGLDPTFTDTTKIYVQPDTATPGNFKLWWCVPGTTTWVNGGSFPLDIPLTAEDISYDLTPTPDLGEGDVQSAIEALDGMVEAVDARMIGYDVIDGIGVKNSWLKDSEETKILPIASGVHEYKSYKNIYASIASSLPRTTNITNSSNTPTFWNINSPQYTVTVGKYYLLIASLTIGEANDGKSGTLQLYPYKSGTNDLLGRTTSSSGGRNTVGAVVGTTYYLYQIFTPTQNTTCYSKIIAQGAGTSAQVFNFVINYLCCFECSTLAEANTLYSSRATLEQSGKDYDVDLFNPLYTEYYKKGVSDGSGMASIVGLGYNIYDYITGEVNMEGFEYGCKLYRASQALSGACADRYKNNTSLVYFPKFDMSAVTTWGSIFNGCTKLQVVPDLNVSSPTGSYQFSGCTNLLEVGDIGSESGTISVYYMFQNCTHLRRVGSIHAKISGSTGRMFYMTSALTHIESINFSLQTTVYTNTGNQTFTSTSNLRYVVLKYLGTPSNCTALNLSLITNWGVATTAEPDARQSLIDTLITYSFDRATEGYSACTITLSANTKALLTEEEIEQITAKGYTIA